MTFLPKNSILMSIGCCIVVEHLPHHPKVKGLSPVATVDTCGEKMMLKSLVVAIGSVAIGSVASFKSEKIGIIMWVRQQFSKAAIH